MVSQVMPFPYTADGAISREYLAAVDKAGGTSSQLLEHRRLSGGQGVQRRPEARGEEPDARATDRRAGVDPARGLRRLHVDFGSRDHVASSYVDLSMLTGDGKVRR